ncbi:hypothetical protein [Streptomyces sp. GbtcB7]|uniref:hypothetical protein n=1 Tax=Streptomyces sp. GbtcB7 TaxID=2824752 RepID=UPI001C303892|nr:hypothetical protein [Streptomyces sp. GbtcB7]
MVAPPGEGADLQQHFGSFDGRFPGVTLRIATDRSASYLKGLMAGESESDLIRRLDDHSNPSANALSHISVLAHEYRHFHDFLLSPWGSEVFVWRVDALLHLSQFMTFLGQSENWRSANSMPVPLKLWCRMTDDQRKNYVAPIREMLWQVSGTDLKLPYLPFIPDDQVFEPADHLRLQQFRESDASAAQSMALFGARTIGAYNRLERLLRFTPPPGVSAELQPAHIAETSALLTQVQEIATAMGAGAAESFLRAMRKQQSTTYDRGLELMMSCFEYGDTELRWDRASTLTAWALLGDYREPIDRANSVYRFSQACLDVARHGWPDTSRLVDVFDVWDKRFSHPSTLAGIVHSVRANRDYLDRVIINALSKKAGSESVGQGATVKVAVRLLRKYVEARERMVSKFLANPDSYLAPQWYIRSQDFPMPPIRLVANPWLMYANINDEAGYYVHTTATAADLGLTSAVSIALDPPQNGIYSAKEACRLYDEFTLCDVLLSEFDRDFHQSEFDLARSWFGDTRFLSIIGTDRAI